MSCALRTALVVAVAILPGVPGLVSTVSAAPMDYQLANAGTQVPYSQLVDAIPTQWKLFTQPTLMSSQVGLPEPAPSALHASNLSEPGLGNPNPTMLGRIVPLGQPGGADRHVWGIYDRLAVLPVPIVLYFDRYLSAPHGIRRPPGGAAPRPEYFGPGGFRPEGSGGSDDPAGYALFVVPEPASVMLLVAGAAMGLPRRRRGTTQAADSTPVTG